MKKIWPLLALGLGAYILFAVATLPAHLITDRLAGSGVNIIGVGGSVWRGNAQSLQIANTNLGTLNWNFRALALLALKISADVELTRTDGMVKCQVGVRPLSRRIDVTKLTAALPVSALPQTMTQGGWNGTVQANLGELVLENGWPTLARGTVEARNLVGPQRRPAELGSFKVSFPAARPVPNTLSGDVSSIDGPLRVAATLQLKAATRGYLLEGMIATQPGTPAEITKALQFLGAPDAQGNRPFSLEGTL
jgi:general secretion pathway protein N